MTVLILLTFLSAPADTLSLQQAYRLAEDAYPLRRQIAVQETLSDLRTANVGVSRLPALSIRGQAVYYSHVAELSSTGLPASLQQPPNDQYRISLNLDQLIYDGGVTEQLKALESVQGDLEQGKVEVELYKLREQVNTAFFGALVFAAQADVLNLLHSDLMAQFDLMRSRVDNGVALQSNADVLAAELLSVEQQQVEAYSNRDWALGVLSELTDRPVGTDDVLLLPESTGDTFLPPGRHRPEFEIFDLSRSILNRQSTLVTRRNRPTVSLFAEGAFGRPPGLDIFETDFTPFYTAGLRMSWNPWKWKSDRRERQMLDLQKELVDAQEESLSRQLSIAVRKDATEIHRLRQQLDRDDEVVELRASITRQAASQLENGVITSSDYLTERNAESRARLALEIHRIQLARAKARYLTTIGQ
jgi:outer membrane protein TolC